MIIITKTVLEHISQVSTAFTNLEIINSIKLEINIVNRYINNV